MGLDSRIEEAQTGCCPTEKEKIRMESHIFLNEEESMTRKTLRLVTRGTMDVY